MRNEAVKPCPQRLSRRFNHKDVDYVMLDSHGFTVFPFFFYILYGHNTYNVLKKGIYDTIIPFTFHLANELHPKKRWARWVMAYPWAVLKSVDRPVAPVVPQMLGHIWTCGLTNWLHRPGTFASFIGTRWPALFWGVGEVKGESWRLGGGK